MNTAALRMEFSKHRSDDVVLLLARADADYLAALLAARLATQRDPQANLLLAAIRASIAGRDQPDSASLPDVTTRGTLRVTRRATSHGS